ncbi:hypothetical protein, partial [Merdimonas faecis]|uniref:hypothetical protein n=1 Tax=Merdimonas faecis TaxID=1653435 RepID=UPI0022E418EA
AFEPGIITLTFCTERIVLFKRDALSVDGKPQIIRKSHVLRTAAMPFSIIKVLVMARAVRMLRRF